MENIEENELGGGDEKNHIVQSKAEEESKAQVGPGQHKRARQNSSQSFPDHGYTGAKKPRDSGNSAFQVESVGSQLELVTDSEVLLTTSTQSEPSKTKELLMVAGEDSNIGNESDSDLDYDDLDDLAVSSDVADFIEDDFAGDSDEDDTSVVSSTTSLSTGSVSSNTPSLVGENLESVKIGSGSEKNKSLGWISIAPTLTNSNPLRASLFPNIPPTINFMLHNEISARELPDNIRKLMKWKLSTITPAIVKRTTSNSGYRLMRKNCVDWNATWGKHMKSSLFKEVEDTQKINHFPGTFNIGRKDKLWRNYHRLMLKHGKAEFGFLPRTFVLPGDAKLLKKVWERRGAKGRWILKPPALARGVGISVVNKLSKIPKNKPLVVQRYVARPYLINGTKFDLRLYLLVTSVNPLRIYLYDNGLVRFASNKYSNDSACVDDVYMHLTNYSINKKSSNYTSNEDAESCQGHKWTLKSLWRHFDAEGIDHKVVWEKIKDLMIKTVISAESQIVSLFHSNVSSRYSCFELFGFDILLDSKLKPWLIEVNISPSLHSSSSLDLDVKSHLTTEVFNMARYHIPNKIKGVEQKEIGKKMGLPNLPSLCLDKRLYVKEISKAERIKHDAIVDSVKMQVSAATEGGKTATPDAFLSPDWILDRLTPDDTRQLVLSEEEFDTTRRFERIFPTADSHRYFKYFEKPRYYNLLLAAWEQKYSGENREAGRQVLHKLCANKHHLKVPANVYVKKTPSGQQTIDISCLAAPSSEEIKTDSTMTVPPTVVPASQDPPIPPSNTTTTEVCGAASQLPLREDERRRMSASSTEMDCGESVTASPARSPEYSGNSQSGTAIVLDERILGSGEGNITTCIPTDHTVVNENYKNSTLGTNHQSSVTESAVGTTEEQMASEVIREELPCLDNRPNNIIMDNQAFNTD